LISLTQFNSKVTAGLLFPSFPTAGAVSSLIPHLPTFKFLEQSMTSTKSYIIQALFAKNIFTKTESAQIIDTFFKLIKQSLQNGEEVHISRFGKFSVKEKYQRTGRNPKTGKPITLQPRKVVTFKCSGVLRAAMNGESD
jgi:integration host factor subunit alpha